MEKTRRHRGDIFCIRRVDSLSFESLSSTDTSRLSQNITSAISNSFFAFKVQNPKFQQVSESSKCNSVPPPSLLSCLSWLPSRWNQQLQRQHSWHEPIFRRNVTLSTMTPRPAPWSASTPLPRFSIPTFPALVSPMQQAISHAPFPKGPRTLASTSRSLLETLMPRHTSLPSLGREMRLLFWSAQLNRRLTDLPSPGRRT
ncbi:hypothetical protein BKA61DRAFT_599845 [Leptodontidium sp. MPI-SDFR-AT-0119]|nr:hypothetical protein BKA61DRAFT_599845 [Leptodontidium sp. MPI-SDFR-AT-0119]